MCIPGSREREVKGVVHGRDLACWAETSVDRRERERERENDGGRDSERESGRERERESKRERERGLGKYFDVALNMFAPETDLLPGVERLQQNCAKF